MDLTHFPEPEFNIHQLQINSYEVNFNNSLAIPSLFNLYQEIAWEHAKMLGFGWEDLREDGLFWALSRFRVEVLKLPLWKEKIHLITYPSGIDGLFALRDYEMYDISGEPLILATSSWLILNLANRKPIRTAEYMKGKQVVNRRSLTEYPSKIDKPSGNPSFSYTHTVMPGEIDVNNHINNVRYIEWAFNAVKIEVFKSSSPQIIEVNYLSEGFLNNQLLVERYDSSDYENLICIKRQDDEKDLSRVYIKWKTY